MWAGDIVADSQMRRLNFLFASPREVLEVILHSTAIVGMPITIMQRRMLEKVMEEGGRGGELDLVS